MGGRFRGIECPVSDRPSAFVIGHPLDPTRGARYRKCKKMSIDLVIWSDYLCPWCHLGTRRVRRIEDEFGDTVRIEWKAFLLRPVPEPGRTLERFRAYTQSWLRPAAEPDAPEFRPW